MRRVVEISLAFGWVLQPSKLTLDMACSIEGLGFVLDTVSMQYSIPARRQQKLLGAVDEVLDDLRALARKGAIEMIAGASRGIRLTESSGLPIVGRVAAGSPILATEHIEDYCELSPGFFSPQADYLLRVTGDSMKDVGILDGDLLAVHSTSTARDGQIVVARIEDEVTVKRLKRSGQHTLKLLPENADFEPIVVDLRSTECAIEGISVGIIRQQG